MRQVALLLALGACTAPAYTFAAVDTDGGGPVIGEHDGSVVDVGDSGVTDAASAVVVGPDATALTMTKMPVSEDFSADCTGYAPGDMGAAPIKDDLGTMHCVMFFHNATWHRTWPEAKAMCEQITHRSQQGHLAGFASEAKISNIAATTSVFPPTLAAWIGLELPPGKDPMTLQNWTWVTGEDSTKVDGWVPGHPAGARCAAWSTGTSGHWIDADCALTKGVLCEMDP